MNYPFWDVGIGYGWLMAVVAVLHVFVSHFAIGGGLYLVVTEHLARRTNDGLRLEFLQRLSKFFVLVTLVFGGLSGVGIWFVIGLLNPAATEVLIHNFVWGWATEWTFFVVEITSALLYYYGWKRISARSHLILGWIYFVAAWLSLFIINGIVTFMLTPGSWLQTGNFWDGFFNPTFWPSLAFRTGVCIMLAGLYALLVASRFPKSDSLTRLVRYNAGWGLAGLILMVPTFYWYWKSIPGAITVSALERMPTPIQAVTASYWYAGGVAVLLILFGFLLAKRYTTVIALVTMLFGLLWFGEYEWFRESIRKPFVITDFMYGNGVEVAYARVYQEEGYLNQMVYRTGDKGADLFRRLCRSCHTLSGYKPLKPVFDGTDEPFIADMVKGTQLMRGHMPPFLGKPWEADTLAAYLAARTDRRPVSQVFGLSGVELGKTVFDQRCAPCHWAGGVSDKTESLAGLSDQEYDDILTNAAELGDGMPAFTASEEERAALIAYFKTLQKGAAHVTP
ncbi:MAG: c-type cytochrome [Candidatus Zixiibacteriota bacterium]